jgi:hypothetical protein
VILLEMVATARTTATAVTHDLFAPLLTAQMTGDLDLLPRGRRSTGQGLERREDERRYPILLTTVAQSAVDLLDEVVGCSNRQSRRGRRGRRSGPTRPWRSGVKRRVAAGAAGSDPAGAGRSGYPG